MSEGNARLVAFPETDAVELRHLRSFVAVAEELNFRRAAERLFITQPALSRQISGLERVIGTQLLHRSTRHVELTLAGEALLERARRLLREVDDAVRVVQTVGGEITARILRLWQPVEDHAGDDGDLHEQRAAYEALLAHAEVPTSIHVHPITAGGVPSLVTTRDPNDAPRVLYLHGGGFVLGSAFGYRPLAGALSNASGAGVVVLDYRLAPEHPFPAALDDARSAYLWMLDHVSDAQRLMLAGDSSGGGLAVALLLRLRDEGVPLPAGVALLCPSADLTFASVPDGDPGQLQLVEARRQFANAYLAGHATVDPLVSPIRGDLSGLPPMMIQAATGDVLLPDAQLLHDRAREHGVQVAFDVYPADAHVFQLFWSFLPEAADAVDAAGRFLAEPAVSHVADSAG